MLISYFGHSCFKIESADYSIVLDPYGDIGLERLSLSADYVFCSHNHFDHNNYKAVKDAEYVTQSNYFKIIPSYHDSENGTKRGKNDILIFVADGIKCAFLGDLGEKLNENLVSKLSGVDLLMIPVGGVYTVNAVEAKEYVDFIKPKIVIPMHYKLNGCTVNVDGVEKFASLFNEVYEVENPYKLQKSNLNEFKVVVIKY